MNNSQDSNFNLKLGSLIFAIIAIGCFYLANTPIFDTKSGQFLCYFVGAGCIGGSIFSFLFSLLFKQKTKVRAGIVMRK